MKKIVCLIICVILSAMTVCACSSTYENGFISHSYERDYQQVIVRIDPMTESGTRSNTSEQWSYTSDEKVIRKTQLVSYINQYGNTYVNSFGMAYDAMVDYLLEQLILSELIIIEADVRFEAHDIFWTKEDREAVEKSVYDSIDNDLFEICNEILDKSNREKLPEPETSDEDADTTYPVMPEEEEETNREFDEDCTYGNGKEHDDWYLGESWYIEDNSYFYSLPGNFGNEDTKSLYREGVKRLVSLYAENAENLINVTDEEKKTINEDVKKLQDLIKTEGVAYAYRQLGRTLLVKKLYGDSAIRSQKMTILQEFIEGGVTVSDDEVVNKYNIMLSDQMKSFKDDISEYDTAATGDDLVLYRANSNYVYVKHILIPFSDEQKAYLTSFKANNSNEDYIAERNRMVNNIVAYRHIDGEDDKDNPLTVAQIWSEVKSTMARKSANAYDAERTFNKFIYEYNTDPGIFDSEMGYAVKYKLNDGESETYMQEFADAARAFRDEGYSVGQVYDDYVVTDYGVHIMYYANDFESGEKLTLDSYTTPGRYTRVRDKIKEDLVSAATDAAYSTWQNEKIYYYRYTKKDVENGDIVNLITKAYKDLYQD